MAPRLWRLQRVALVWRVAFAGLAASALGCTEASPAATGIGAGDEARARGVEGYDVVSASAHDLDVQLRSATPARLRIHTAEGETVQRLDGPIAFALATSQSHLRLEVGGRPRLVAEKSGEAWLARDAIDPLAARAIELVLAIDIDLAAQGSSLVFGGSVLARCSETCEKATRCAGHFEADRCAPSIVLCGACLEQEP